MKRRKLADVPEHPLEPITIEDDDDFLPSPVAKRFQFAEPKEATQKEQAMTISIPEPHQQKAGEAPTIVALATEDFPDFLSQAAAEGFVESDSDDSSSDQECLYDADPTPARPPVSPFDPRSEPASTDSPSQQTLDCFLGVQRSSSFPSPPVQSKAPPKQGKKSKVPWFDRSPTAKESAPFYKRIPETTFLVDDFRFIYKDPPTKMFFLSHFHADHYGGLNNKFDRGTVICSQITANLLRSGLGVPAQFIRALPMREPVEIDTGRPDGSKCTITLIDANHCPGAVCFLFQLPSGRVHLHTGDFRFDPEHPDHQMLTKFPKVIDNVYLDTTYCNQNYNFPPQREVVERSLEVMLPYTSDPRTLIVVGAYTIGKERIFLQAAQRFNLRVFCSPHKFKIMSCLCLEPKVLSLLTKDDASARIHVVPIGIVNMKGMEKYLRDRPLWRRVVAFKPTGWTYDSRSNTEILENSSSSASFETRKKDLGNGLELVVVNVPYSEHSSFGELRQFVRTVKSRMLIPTVNNYNGSKVKEMLHLLKQQT